MVVVIDLGSQSPRPPPIPREISPSTGPIGMGRGSPSLNRPRSPRSPGSNSSLVHLMEQNSIEQRRDLLADGMEDAEIIDAPEIADESPDWDRERREFAEQCGRKTKVLQDLSLIHI